MTGPCRVWWARPAPAASLLSLLAPAERRRAAGIAHREAQDRFVTGRALVRLVLADRLGLAPAAIPIGQDCPLCGSGDHGPPELLGPAGPPVHFGITHAPGRVGVAVNTGAIVAIDVAAVDDPTDPQRAALADIALSDPERTLYDRLPADRRARAAARWWTRKEAILKATGWGLSVAPALVGVTAPDRAPELLVWPRECAPGPGGEVFLRDLNPSPHEVACVAILGPAVDLVELNGEDVLSTVSSRGPPMAAR